MADNREQIGPDEIEELLKQAQAAARPQAPKSASPPPPATTNFSLADDEFKRIVGSASQATAAAASASVVATAPPPVTRAAERPTPSSSSTADDIQLLLNQAEQALASVDHPEESTIPGLTSFSLKDFSGSPPSNEKATLDLLRDVELDLKIELGRTQMYLEEVLKLRRGSVVALDKLAGDPVDIYVNGRLIARGEVLVLNDSFCVRVAELVSGEASTA